MEEKRHIPGVSSLFYGALLVATGYGATFVFNRHFKSFGGDEIDTGAILVAAMIGTLISVSFVGWCSARFGAATLAAIGSLFISLGFAIMMSVTSVTMGAILASGAIGIGWGAFYLAAPMALSQRVSNTDRGYWFTRFAAFQMAGIGLSPFIAEFMLDQLTISTSLFFGGVSAACLLAACLLFIFESRSPVTKSSGAMTPWVRSIGLIFSTPSRFPIIMVALGAGVFSGAMTFQSSLVENTPLTAGTFFVTYAITVVVARWFLARMVTGYSSRVTVPLLLMIMTAGVALLYALGYGVAAQFASAILFGIGYGLVYPLIQTQAVNDAPGETCQNAALTWFVLSYFVGIFGFPLIGGWIIVHVGTTALISTIVALGTLEFLLSLWRNRQLPMH
ncbi:MFS transporter [Labrenzia sp. CE80]|uniref:MFS transporter n=1 Tax=Labrenzia sp. CE80 TaxID=1788986 RepID=UPI0013897143|nr:MFS transporter [Labrenzia sp. CE80]